MYRLFLFDKISTCITDLHSVYLSDYQFCKDFADFVYRYADTRSRNQTNFKSRIKV